MGDDGLGPALQRVLDAVPGYEGVHVEGLRRLSGGASRETWAFHAVGEAGTGRALVLRRDPPPVSGQAMGATRQAMGATRQGMSGTRQGMSGTRQGMSGTRQGMSMESRLLRAAADVGVPVPPVVVTSDDASLLGSPFIVTEHVEGETIPRRILSDEAFATARPRLARQCGSILAIIHRIPVTTSPELADGDQLAQLRVALDALGQPHPAFELALRWLQEHQPPRAETTVVHGDFRNGNLIVGAEGVRAVLDWELAHLGDPCEDLGWLCVRAWRFGERLPVGGFGTYEDLLRGYTEAGGHAVAPEVLRWWEMLGNLKWGVICIHQAAIHTSGALRSVELAAIGRRVCEVEWDLLELLDEAG